jgi:hypothetical protein
MEEVFVGGNLIWDLLDFREYQVGSDRFLRGLEKIAYQRSSIVDPWIESTH